MQRSDELQFKIDRLPDSPGCYIMKDAGGEIIYVGKAINLKHRVKSYFMKTAHTPKVAAMVANVADFDILLCDTELEALALECNLIKRHKPYYNIRLKDDKHYPYLRINLKEPFPRLTLARRIEKDGAKYFGPYIGANQVRQVIEAVRDVFPLRNCKLNLPLKKPIRPCIHYDIGKCPAPCANLCTEAEYWDMMDGVLAFLNGDYSQVVASLEKEMQTAAARMKFEQAAILRDKIRHVERLTERQIAIQTAMSEQDIIALAQDGLDAMVQIVYVRGGRMIGGEHFILPREGGESPGEVLSSFLMQYYEDGNLIPRHVLVQELGEDQANLEQWLRQQKGGTVTLAVPKRGEKHDMILLAQKNAMDALEKRNARASTIAERTTGAVAALAEILGLPNPPRRIEGFDISNTQGVYAVASMVVFIDGVPAKKEYRHFRIKTVEGANDFASMEEVLTRRFTHGLREGAEREAAGLPLIGGRFSDMPDLVLVDGGPQQLRFALEAMKNAGVSVPMFGLAERLEAIYLPDREAPILLDHHTPELHLLQRIRDEAHRFAIIHHRTVRGKAAIHSQLEEIPGIGPKRRKALLLAFPSIKMLKEATREELLAVSGMTAAAADAVLAWSNAQGNPQKNTAD